MEIDTPLLAHAQEESGRLKRELMTQVEQLLEGFLAKGGSLITTSVDSVVSGATRITSLLDDKHRAIETSNGRASSKLSEMQSHMAALVEGGAERSEGTLTRVDATMGKVSDALKHTAAAVTERVSQLQQAADEHTATLLKLHRNAGDAVHAIGNDHVAKIQAEAARLKAAVGKKRSSLWRPFRDPACDC